MPLTILTILLLCSVAFATLALVMTIHNLCVYRRRSPTPPPISNSQRVYVCIPARNEQSNIEAAVTGALASNHPSVRVLVYDDDSSDQTPAILSRLIAKHDRIEVIPRIPLPSGWVGKMHACHQLGTAAVERDPTSFILFVDADVSLDPAAIPRALEAAATGNADLVSTFPRQILQRPGDALLVPMIFFILFSYLPMALMRKRRDPGMCAGCGQFLFVSARAYHAIRGHTQFKDSMHDGIRMPRLVRAAGYTTDLFDGTSVAACRMYNGLTDAWQGFLKNAYEGLGSPILLCIFTTLHLIGHVLPWIALPALLILQPDATLPLILAAFAIAIAITQRLMLTRAFHQPAWLALAHPLSILLMTIVQWQSFINMCRGKRTWRGRTVGKLASN